jgi:hypothetical protein
MNYTRASINELVGKILTKIDKTEDTLTFICNTGDVYTLYHDQDCCESVNIEDICGDLDDLIGSPILIAEEVSNNDFVEMYNQSFNIKDKYGNSTNAEGHWMPDSFTWTFYKFATIKGYVDVRWFGESNGYYSESVECIKTNIL